MLILYSWKHGSWSRRVFTDIHKTTQYMQTDFTEL